MDDSFRQQESETQQSNNFFVSLQVLNGILEWLASFVRLTEDEQEDAGIYLDRLGDE